MSYKEKTIKLMMEVKKMSREEAERLYSEIGSSCFIIQQSINIAPIPKAKKTTILLVTELVSKVLGYLILLSLVDSFLKYSYEHEEIWIIVGVIKRKILAFAPLGLLEILKLEMRCEIKNKMIVEQTTLLVKMAKEK